MVVEKQSRDEAADTARRRKERVNRVWNSVHACFEASYESERVTSNAAWSRVKRFRGTEQPRKRWFDVAKCKRLTNACAPDFRRIVQGGLLTGARWSELRRLRAEDYDHEAGTLLIAESKAAKPRHVYLTDEGRAVFADWTAGLDRGALIFTRDTGDPWNSHDQHRPMRAACAVAKIEPAVGFHVLRHSYASILVKKGVPLAIVAEALGHTDTRMVSKHYGHLAPSHVAETIRAKLPSFGIEVAGNVRKLRQ